MKGRSLLLLALPPLLPVVAAALLLRMDALPPSADPVLSFLPIGLLGFVFLVGWRFNRSRVAFAALLVLLAYEGLGRFALAPDPTTGEWSRVADYVLVTGTFVLVPLNLAWISLWRERGVLTPPGILRIVALGAQVGFLVWVSGPEHLSWTAWLNYAWVGPPVSNWLTLPQPAVAAFILAAGFLIARLVVKRVAVDAGLLAVLVGTFLLFSAPLGSRVSQVFATATAIALLVSLIEMSYALAFRDELTGLPGRRALNELLSKMGQRYTVAMVDIDHFKKFNDRYGHDTGDQALRMVAGKMAAVLGGGRSFRYGGEEFTVVFPGKDAGECEPFLEALRRSIADQPFLLRSQQRPEAKSAARRGADKTAAKKRGKSSAAKVKKIKVTVSIGAAARKDHGPGSDEVVKAADKLLYKSKKAGRNRVTV